ncbi:UNC93-like protein MFSD11 [Glossina fuscipes]|uniref:UNC93-like protein MFSD11 n=1 Tax=Glossina fuscipes TaxID=7396 RepID=A0A8U0WGB6_9MUSC|nr:UNC93-like protein MFSD11 [Glossina fuscipes]
MSHQTLAAQYREARAPILIFILSRLKMDAKFWNIIVMGFGYMLIFTAFQTLGNIEKNLLASLAEEDKTFSGDGFISLASIYVVFAFANWLAPSVLAVTGPRISIISASLFFSLFTFIFFFTSTWLLYTVGVLLGIAAAVVWTAQGVILSRCSDSDTIARNSGLFWVMYELSFIFGNMLVIYEFRNKKHIDANARREVVWFLTASSILGTLSLFALRNVPKDTFNSDEELQQPELSFLGRAWFAFRTAVQLFVTRDMLLLNVTFIYTGLLTTFVTGLYGAIVGFTKKLATKDIIGMVGICIGAGEVFGGCAATYFAPKIIRYAIDVIILTGYGLHMFSFALVMLNLPNKAPFADTDDVSFIDPPRVWIALLCAFLTGVGDACIHIQIYSLLGVIYANQSAEAFAIFTFVDSLSASIAFFYAIALGLYGQVAILMLFSTLGSFTICFLKWNLKRLQSVNMTP